MHYHPMCEQMKKYATMHPTGQLRWRELPSSEGVGKTLQQEWEIINYYMNAPHIRETEWRDVPKVTE